MPLEITFSGLEAQKNHIEADEGLESLAGMAHAATLVAHFVATGKIRQRTPYDNRLRFFFQDTRPGSLTALLELGGALAIGVAGNAVYDVLKATWQRAIGIGEEGDLETEAANYRSGDLDALADALSPSLLRGHSWIDHPQQIIKIRTGRQIISEFNQLTKRHLKEEIFEDDVNNQDVSVAALNVNARTGRVFFFNLGRTIPFRVPKDANGQTIPNLSIYLTKYAEKNPKRVNIEFQKISRLDGTLKRILIKNCKEIDEI